MFLCSFISLIVFNQQMNTIPTLTNIHTILVFLWSMRLLVFLLYREYFSWPQLHVRMQETNERAKLQSKFSIWMSCSCYYTCLFLPCLSRMQQAIEKNNNL